MKKSENESYCGNEILIYKAEDGHIKINVKFENKTIWLTRHNYSNCTKLVKLILVNILNIFLKEELEENIVASDKFDFNEEELRMEYIQVTKDNIEKEHICCAISNNKDIQVSSKRIG